MSKRESFLYLNDILEAINKISNFTDQMMYEGFIRDAKTIDAVVRNIEIIGEAASHLPREIKLKYPKVPWSQIVGSRIKVAHEYFGIDLKIIWKTVQEDLPLLRDEVNKAIKELA